jgi:hypothetical protein
LKNSARHGPSEAAKGSRFRRYRNPRHARYECGIRTIIETGKEEPTGLPESNVLYYETIKGLLVLCTPIGDRTED